MVRKHLGSKVYMYLCSRPIYLFCINICAEKTILNVLIEIKILGQILDGLRSDQSKLTSFKGGSFFPEIFGQTEPFHLISMQNV